jgi:hypothetical protein
MCSFLGKDDDRIRSSSSAQGMNTNMCFSSPLITIHIVTPLQTWALCYWVLKPEDCVMQYLPCKPNIYDEAEKSGIIGSDKEKK